ncbi:inhibitor of apoptosis-promoting Bax1-domain-containing protein [Boletus reticuloceps]|uniref:Inhibitor of apoptosis-promoting Bax1-domain-containing protein n=1 Tax=Boletus reticuloceps TaxID=495285 RepID=A0A8I2YYW5_9AGAM|nr:inhibitor of apoptosis-promoting Bax1-domain-containing protein [Boletus reticuloceps]
MTTMLSLVFKPALSRSALQAVLRPRVQPFSSTRFGTLNVVQKRPTIFSPPAPFRLFRTIITGAQTVTHTSSQFAWKNLRSPQYVAISPTYGFNACQAATLSPLFFISPAILSRAALYTCGVVGSLSYVGATAKNDKYLYMGGPLLAGVTVVALSSLAPMALPLGMRGLAVAESISLYGGLAVFGGFVLYDTQKILQHARMAEMGAIPRDPMKEAIALELDMINIFVRLVQILMMRSNNRK